MVVDPGFDDGWGSRRQLTGKGKSRLSLACEQALSYLVRRSSRYRLHEQVGVESLRTRVRRQSMSSRFGSAEHYVPLKRSGYQGYAASAAS